MFRSHCRSAWLVDAVDVVVVFLVPHLPGGVHMCVFASCCMAKLALPKGCEAGEEAKTKRRRRRQCQKEEVDEQGEKGKAKS